MNQAPTEKQKQKAEMDQSLVTSAATRLGGGGFMGTAGFIGGLVAFGVGVGFYPIVIVPVNLTS